MSASFDFPAFFQQAGWRLDGNEVAAIVLLVLGALLMVARHPLRRELSEAFDFLITRRLPLWLTLLALGLEALWGIGTDGRTKTDDAGGKTSAFSDADGESENRHALVEAIFATAGPPAADAGANANADARDLAALGAAALPVVKSVTLRALRLLHEAIRPLPLAVLLPVWLVMATVGLSRYPYRYQREKLRAEQRTVLWVASALSIVWSGVYLFSFSRSPVARAQLEAVMQPATVIFAALAAAAYQVWLARSVIQWARPEEEPLSARDETIARWQNVLWLAAFHATWTALWLWMEGAEAAWLPWSGLAELLFAFAPLPVAIAMVEGRASSTAAGGAALRMLARSWFRLLIWTLTAVLLLGSAEIAIELSGTLSLSLPALTGLPLGGGENDRHTLQAVTGILVRGLLHGWLVPAAMLAMWRSEKAA